MAQTQCCKQVGKTIPHTSMCVVNFTFCKSSSVISVKETKELPNSTEGGIKVFGRVVKVGSGRFSSDSCPMNLYLFFEWL